MCRSSSLGWNMLIPIMFFTAAANSEPELSVDLAPLAPLLPLTIIIREWGSLLPPLTAQHSAADLLPVFLRCGPHSCLLLWPPLLPLFLLPFSASHGARRRQSSHFWALFAARSGRSPRSSWQRLPSLPVRPSARLTPSDRSPFLPAQREEGPPGPTTPVGSWESSFLPRSLSSPGRSLGSSAVVFGLCRQYTMSSNHREWVRGGE